MLRLAVTDNQSVAAGDLLFTIDPQPYQIELDREKAALALAQANLSGAKDRLVLAQNNIDGKKATFDDATINRDRGLQLLKQNVVSEETVDNLERTFKVAEAELGESRAARVVAEQDIAVQNAEVQRVETAVAKAEWELSKTQIKSPARGRVAPFQIRPGTFLEVGKSVLAIVTADNWRVMANLPERHLSGLQVGQPVWVQWAQIRGESIPAIFAALPLVLPGLLTQWMCCLMSNRQRNGFDCRDGFRWKSTLAIYQTRKICS
jgi:membrane fusion protein, multidrug efflux system